MTQWGHLMFQDAASPIMIQMILFHDYALIILTLVITVVGYALIALMFNKFSARFTSEAQQVETVWTVLPAIVLVFLALPSLRLLYLTDELSQPSLTVKAIGHQWYWSYEYSDFPKIEFDSYMLPDSDLTGGEFRVLEVDNRMVLPMNLEVRLLVTAADVIHSWAVPSLGVKIDAIPGRLNQLGFSINRPGVFYGQCSEICGANHSFMPIAMEIIDTKSFINWTTSFN